MDSIQQHLFQLGLNNSDIEIYLLLAQHQQLTGAKLIELSSVSRATVYDSIATLKESGLIEELHNDGRKTTFQLAHPQALVTLAEKQAQKKQQQAEEMHAVANEIISTYNITLNKPGVYFYDGEAGVRKALFDSLTASGEILTIANADVTLNYAKELNEEYVAERLRLKIPKKMIVPDSPLARGYAAKNTNAYTTIKFIDASEYPLEATHEIYDDTVTSLLVNEETQNILAFVTHNATIAQQQRSLFMHLWNRLAE